MNNKKLPQSFAVIGCGHFGTSMALALAELGKEVMCVDKDKNHINDLSEYVTYAIQADVTEEGSLDGIGLHNMDCAIIGVSENFEASILATSTCREKKIPTIIAKAQNAHHKRILQRVGATSTIIPEEAMGKQMAYNLCHHNLLNYIELSEEYAIEEIDVPKAWIGKNLADLDIRNRYHINIIGINNTDFLTINPKPDDCFHAGDHVFMLGKNADILAVREMKN